MESNKKVLIVDLDNTLYDWVHIWYECYSNFMNKLHEISHVDIDTIYNDISTINKKYHTAEYCYIALIAELPTFREFLHGRDPYVVFANAIAEFQKQRETHLKLYDTVYETMKTLKSRGVRIIAYTEAHLYYTEYRIKHTGLDGIMTDIFATKTNPMSFVPTLRNYHLYADEASTLCDTYVHQMPVSIRKPDPRGLNHVMDMCSVSPEECVYVGDNLFKDIPMAQACGVTDVYARYGYASHRPEYDLLRKVTFWSPEDVEREREICSRGTVTPTITIDQFSELLDLF